MAAFGEEYMKKTIQLDLNVEKKQAFNNNNVKFNIRHIQDQFHHITLQ